MPEKALSSKAPIKKKKNNKSFKWRLNYLKSFHVKYLHTLFTQKLTDRIHCSSNVSTEQYDLYSISRSTVLQYICRTYYLRENIICALHHSIVSQQSILVFEWCFISSNAMCNVMIKVYDMCQQMYWSTSSECRDRHWICVAVSKMRNT